MLISAVIGAVVALLGLTQFRGRSLIAIICTPIAYWWRRKRRRNFEIDVAPFNIPLKEGGTYGMRWDGTCVTTMLRIDAPPRALTFLSPGSLVTEETVPLPEIAKCLTQFDIELESIDVVSVGSRSFGTNDVAQIYDQVLGPLPATAHRVVYVVLRMNPLANAAAVERRGGGSSGTVETAIVATRRVANRLAGRDLQVSVLSAGELTGAVAQLTGNIGVAQMTERWRTVEAHNIKLTSYEIGSELLLDSRRLTDIWAASSLSTTLTLRLRPAPKGAIALNGIARFDTLHELAAPPVPGLHPMRARQFRALLASLPIGAEQAEELTREHVGPAEALAAITLPAAGCGQLVGADQRGRAVALPLVGYHVRRVEIVGTLHLAQQVILRAIALGAKVVVHTNRHDAWKPMVTRLASLKVLSLASWSAGSQLASSHQSATVVVFDGIAITSHISDATIIRLSPRGSRPDRDADVTLIQDSGVASSVTVRTAAGSVGTTMVATPQEMRYIGASLNAADSRTPVNA